MEKILKGFQLFDDLSESELQKLSKIASLKNFKKGEYLFHQNEPRNNFYLINEGYIEIVKSRNNTVVPVIKIVAGNFISENAILDDRPHGSSALCSENCELVVFNKNELNSLLDKEKVISGKIFPAISKSLSDRLYKMNVKKTELETRSYSGKYRNEHDLLGDKKVPDDVYYGIQTLRAKENFDISGIPLSHFPDFIASLAYVKKAAAMANFKVKNFDESIKNAICLACDEIIQGDFHEDFIVDMIQGGAGTSTNMNANEVIANRASEIMGAKKGEYSIHPNNHVNLSQSTNDAYPTAIRITTLMTVHKLINAMKELKQAFIIKGDEFTNVLKMGRTQLQDAVPMTLGQEFNAYAETIAEDIFRIKEAVDLFKEINMGGTAIGTGINADPEFGSFACDYLSNLIKIQLRLAPNLIEATPDTGAFIVFSSMLKRIAVKLSKICNDLRLLSSGPRAGFNEINLPPMQPGSSIMPGKVNPVIPEVVNQVAFQIIGNDLTVTMAAEAGQLQLNVMEPIIVFNIFQSMQILENAIRTLTTKCITGITANVEHCKQMVHNSIAIVTALNPYIGYENSSKIAKEALSTGKSLKELVLEYNLLSAEKLDQILQPDNMISPKRIEKN
jgi:aspartate ammonia-lyase